MTESYTRMLFMRFAEEAKVRFIERGGGEIKVVSVLEFGFRRGAEEQVSLCLGMRWIVNLYYLY